MKQTALLWVLAVSAPIAACDDSGTTPPVRTGVVADTADQTMFGVSVTLTDRGIRRADLRADTAYMYEDNTRTELRTVVTTFFTETGVRNGTLTAREGTYNVRLGNMEARGDVVVVSDSGRRLTTQQLRYDPARNEISSDSAFVLTEPEQRVTGIGFVSDPNLNSVRVLKAAAGSTNRSVVQPSR